MRAIFLSLACVVGLSIGAGQASAGGFSIGIGVYRPAPPVIIQPVPAFYPPVYPYYPPPLAVQPAPIIVAPVRPVYYPGWTPYRPVPVRQPWHSPWRR